MDSRINRIRAIPIDVSILASLIVYEIPRSSLFEQFCVCRSNNEETCIFYKKIKYFCLIRIISTMEIFREWKKIIQRLVHSCRSPQRIPISDTAFHLSLSTPESFCSKIKTSGRSSFCRGNLAKIREYKISWNCWEKKPLCEGLDTRWEIERMNGEEAVFSFCASSLFFSSIENRFELKRAAADLTSGPLRPVNRIKWNGGLTKWQWSTRTRRFLFPVQRCGHCSSSRCLSAAL